MKHFIQNHKFTFSNQSKADIIVKRLYSLKYDIFSLSEVTDDLYNEIKKLIDQNNNNDDN